MRCRNHVFVTNTVGFPSNFSITTANVTRDFNFQLLCPSHFQFVTLRRYQPTLAFFYATQKSLHLKVI